MTLENLCKVGKLHAHEPSTGEITLLLASARRSLQDANVTVISSATRFDKAYKTIVKSAMVGMLANGYRPATGEPGHHVTLLQSLPKTVGMPNDQVVILDALRKKRNSSDYAGVEIAPSIVDECIQIAEKLLAATIAWLETHRPELV
ncbi:MAG: DNA-binding protein [bacterium]